MQPVMSTSMSYCNKSGGMNGMKGRQQNQGNKGNTQNAGDSTQTGITTDPQAGTTYLANIKQALQAGQMPTVDALAKNFPYSSESPQANQLMGQVNKVLSQAGGKGAQTAQQLGNAVYQRQGNLAIQSRQKELANTDPNSPKAQALQQQILAIQNAQKQGTASGNQGQNQNCSLTNTASGGMANINTSQDAPMSEQLNQLKEAFMLVFSQISQILKSSGNTQTTTQQA